MSSGGDSNPRPSGYEPDEPPDPPPRVARDEGSNRSGVVQPPANASAQLFPGARSPPMTSPPIAVVDLGTNSTRLLVAEACVTGAEELERRTNVTRLGEGVDGSGRLVGRGRRAREPRPSPATAEPLTGSAPSAPSPSPPARCATPPTGPDLLDALARSASASRSGTIPGDEEARLDLQRRHLRRRCRRGTTMVIDIGGGSAEYAVGYRAPSPTFHASTRPGSVRRAPSGSFASDLPLTGELEALRGGRRRSSRPRHPGRGP